MLVRRLDENHDMTFGRAAANFISGHAAVEQKLETRFLTLLGEWFLDTDAGVPWLTKIDIKNPDIGYIESLLKQEAVDTEDVLEVLAFSLTRHPETRRPTISMTYLDIYSSEASTLEVTQ